MRVDLFDFELPESAIALRPAEPRHAARLLAVDPGKGLHDDTVWELDRHLKPGDALVLNDTRVIPARLDGVRIRNGEHGEAVSRISATLHMRMGANRWKAFARPAKRLRPGDRFRFVSRDSDGLERAIEGAIESRGGAGEVVLAFDLAGAALDQAIHATGHIPLPPYIASKRSDDARDRADYQTIYAREEGAVAAPTAGLHFTGALFDKLDAAGIERHFVTLHVGAGTFLPVKADDTDDHVMHAEIGEVSARTADALNAVKARGGRIVSIGTTSLRLLESATDASGQLHPWTGATDIFITPGHRFRFVDLLMTNFHLPRSTLFMLVSAFCGVEVMREAYNHAIEKGYRFYSYGDSSLLKRADLP